MELLTFVLVSSQISVLTARKKKNAFAARLLTQIRCFRLTVMTNLLFVH